MENFDIHIYELQTLGFTIVRNVIDAKTITTLKSKLDTALAEDEKMFSGKEGKNPDLAVDLTIHDPYFIKILDNDIILEMYYRLLDKSCILYSYTSTILKPKVMKTAVQSIHVDTFKFIPGYITGIVMTLALDDFTAENGATLYLPGSHNLEAQPGEETFSKYSLSTARAAGDALFFNPRVWHRAANNNTDKIRYGLTVYATRSFMKQRFDFPEMIPEESLNGLSERLINFLGYNSVPPKSVDQYYSPKKKLPLKQYG